MKTGEDLKEILRRIDRKSYPAYKETKGSYSFGSYVLSIDHVQGDSFASPSKISIHIEGKQAGFLQEHYDRKWRRIALCDYLLRRISNELYKVSGKAGGTGKSGLFSVSRPGQEILERSALGMDENTGKLILCLEAGFPANGRSVNAGELEKMLFVYLPSCIKKCLYYKSLDAAEVKKAVNLADDVHYIREEIKARKLIAFVANGAVLPRETGISGRPMKGAVKFKAPAGLEVTLTLPHYGVLKGMGIKKGVTLIVGGGYHGKSTLLKALELGVYDHIGGDGREYVITDDTAMKIRAEDGRSVKHVDISMFIRNLPSGRNTKAFETEDASGSTSQAANVIEAMEAGAGVLLMDEDTSATNFMVRDELMQRVVHRDAEPITPFIDRVRALYESCGISTILVAGSSGSFFHKADLVLQMNQYEPVEITAVAKKEAGSFPLPVTRPEPFLWPDFSRIIRPVREWKEDSRVKIKTMGKDYLSIQKETVELRYVEQLVDAEQLEALGFLMIYANTYLLNAQRTVQEMAEALYQKIEKDGFEIMTGKGGRRAGLAMPRKQEICACLNRIRKFSIAAPEKR